MWAAQAAAWQCASNQQEYLGTDISSEAIARARFHYGELPLMQFQVSSLQEFNFFGGRGTPLLSALFTVR